MSESERPLILTPVRVRYDIKPRLPYTIDRHAEAEDGSILSSSVHGSFSDPDVAWEIAYALCDEEHKEAGYDPGSDRYQYPEHPLGGISDYRVWPG